jgi:hypothetical protein
MQSMRIARTALAAAVLVGVVACGGDDDGTAAPRTTTSTAPTTSVPALEQPAIWPAAGVALGTPEAAARDFAATVLGVEPALGAFEQGDARSGEIPLLVPGGRVVRSTLVLRQLGPSDGWFVLAAVHDQTAIAEPAAGAEVAAGPITVRGQGRGFEGNLVVVAMRPGDTVPLDQAVTTAGSGPTAEPFEVTLDLSGAQPGETVLLLVRGGTGQEGDPGELSAIPVTIAR